MFIVHVWSESLRMTYSHVCRSMAFIAPLRQNSALMWKHASFHILSETVLLLSSASSSSSVRYIFCLSIADSAGGRHSSNQNSEQKEGTRVEADVRESQPSSRLEQAARRSGISTATKTIDSRATATAIRYVCSSRQLSFHNWTAGSGGAGGGWDCKLESRSSQCFSFSFSFYVSFSFSFSFL